MSSEKIGNKIAVVGELNVDLIAAGLPSEPKLGLEILAEEFEITLGSASAIFASGAAKLGNEVTFLSLVGGDDFGKFCLQKLNENGVSTSFVKRSESSKTGVTVVLSLLKDRAMITYLGAIAELSFADINIDNLNGCNHLHLTSYFLQKNLQADFPRLMKEAKQRGLSVSFDPNSDPTQSWDDKIYEVIENTDILFLNETEALNLTKQADVKMAVQQLGKHCPTVVVKLGEKGAIGRSDGKTVETKGFIVEAVDTTGAGDSFAAGFVHAFLDGRDFNECLRIGNACGALSTRKAGGTNAQPILPELEDFLSKND